MMVRVLALLAGLLLASNAWAQAVPKTTTPAPVAPKAQPTAPQVAPKAVVPATPAGPIPAAIVVVVDVAQVRANSLAAKDIQRQMAAIQEVYAAEIARLEDQLRAQEQELQRQQAILAGDAFAARRREFEAAVDRAQRLVEDRNRTLDRLFSEAMGKVTTAIVSALTEMQRERGFNVVLDRNQVLIPLAALDITAETQARVDQRLPSVAVTLPPER
jgi:Skp family chaperone for outer membrane proteins